jgi:PAS domain S-box-containing protein
VNEASPSTEPRDPITILMVDDQPSKLLSYEVILAELGEHLVKASSAREALDILLKTDVAMVLMDVSMPDIDGFELADMIRQHPRFQKIPIIFVSAVHLTELDRIRGYQSGAVDYIAVPVVPEVLRAKVSVFAELHHKTRQLQALNRELESRVAQRSQELRLLNGQLEQRVAELESIMQMLPVGVAVAHSTDCKVITGNAAFSEMLGVAMGDNLSIGALDPHTKVTQNGRPLAEHELPVQRAALTGQVVDTTEIEITPADGITHHVLASASPLFDEEGKVRGAVGAFFDITDRKRLDRALQERADLLELATEAIMVRDHGGTIRFWNAGAEALYGWTREEALGQNAHTLLCTDVRGGVAGIAESLTQDGSWEGNLKQRRKDGSHLIVVSRQAVQKDSSVVLEINRDITAQLHAEEALRRNERLAAMGKLAGIVAHEINNPLEAITNTFYLLRQHPSLDEEARHYAALADQELARVSHITKQTLSFYRESQTPTPLLLSELMDDVLELQERNLLLARARVERRYRTSGAMDGFPSEIKQVIMNLVTNAMQAMPDGGRLRLTIRHSGHSQGRSAGYRVFVSDTGCGIEPEHLKRLFDPFFTTKAAKGTGLGLWISRGIIQKHEGTLMCRSVRLPSGAATAFQIWLPRSVETKN